MNHPNIAQIYAVEGTAFIMELVPGETLGERMKRGPVPLDEALKLAEQMASALDAAHEKGIVHRDFKPGNVMVTPDGVVKVLDFGLVGRAPSVSNGNASVDPEDSPTLTMAATQAGFIMGTAAYMAPEQASGKAVDKRADIWSFGVVLWEMLTGKRLFEGETISHVLAAVLTKEPDLNAVPVRVRPLLASCLEKDPKRRLRDVGDAMRLVAVTGMDPVQTGSRAERPPARWAWAIAAIGVIAAAGFAFLAFRPKPEPIPEVTRFEINAPAGATIPLGTPAVSPDGRTIAYVVAEKDGKQVIYTRRVDAIEARPLPGTEGAVHPFFSPDGQSLAFAAEGRVKQIELATGAVQAVFQTSGPWHGTWGRDGILLPLGLFSASGKQIQAFDYTESQTQARAIVAQPFFLPDEHRYLSVRSGKLELGSIGSKDTKVLLQSTEFAGYAASTPGGAIYVFFAQGGNVMAQHLDEATGELTGLAELILTGVGRQATPALAMTMGVSNSGTLAYQRGNPINEYHLSWVDRTGKAIGGLPPSMLGDQVSLSPDGRSAVVRRGQGPGRNDISVLDLQQGTATRLTFDQADHSMPVFTPDGKRVSYYTTADSGKIVMKDVSGQGQETDLKRSNDVGNGDRLADWSPDGKLALLQRQSGPAYLVAVEKGRLVLDRTMGDVGPKSAQNSRHLFSPDGKYVAYESGESGREEIYVEAVPPASGRWQVSATGGNLPRWRKDGKELYFRGTSNGGLALLAVDVQRADGAVSFGTPHALFNSLNNGGYDVSSDGQRFLMALVNQATDAPIVVVQNWWAALRKK